MPHLLYVAVLETRGYIVGESNAESGLHRYDGVSWTHLGWPNLRLSGAAVEPGRPETIYLAAGNGILRSIDGGQSWRVTTDWQITEVQAVAADPYDPERIYAATAYGVVRTEDRGESWLPCSTGIPEPNATFVQTIATDRSRRGRLIAGSEDGLFVSEDGARSWHRAGADGVAVRSIRQSPHTPDLWIAATEDHGLLISRNGGMTWNSVDGETRSETFYAVALDPSNEMRMASAGYETGVYLSDDGGASWRLWAADLPESTIHGLAFDPMHSGQLWVGTVGSGVFVVHPEGHWNHVGLDSATVRDMFFVRTVS